MRLLARLTKSTVLAAATFGLFAGLSALAAAPLYTFTTPNPQTTARFGARVAVGDVNGDGKADIVVGAPYENVGPNSQQGRVYVFSGANGSLLYTLTSPNPEAGGFFGYSVAVGDVNGDGKDDIVVGAAFEAGQAGRVYVFSGASGGLLYTFVSPNGGGLFGNSVASGDVNHDGKADVLVGAPSETVASVPGAGRAYAFSGATGALLYTFTSPNPQPMSGSGAQFGFAVAAGDVNADGNADVVIGAQGEDVGVNAEQGRVYEFSGLDGSLLYTLVSPNPQTSPAFFGGAVATGDVNGDGKQDVIVGTSETVAGNSGAGRVYAFSGASGGLLYTLVSPNSQVLGVFGEAVASGDLNGDGKADVVVGAYQETADGNTFGGHVYHFSGASGSLLGTLTTPNPQSNALFGFSIATGDIDGDHRADIVVGSPGETVAGNSGQGRTYAFLTTPASSVGGIAEAPDMWALPARTEASGNGRSFYSALATLVSIGGLALAGTWALRRRHRHSAL